MKKLVFIFSVIAVLTLSTLTAFALDGDGTEKTPFLITNQGELEMVTDFPDCHFKLANDIELEGTWIPLCRQTSSGEFKGVFDGAGYTISNLSIDASFGGGLFYNNYGTIRNIKVITADNGMEGSGIIAASNYGTISNCTAIGIISGIFDNTGGICADNYKNISGCKFEGNVVNSKTKSYTGGICGKNSENGIIMKCKVAGNITGTSSTGGICGKNSEERTISTCAVIGNITGGSFTGGICGTNYAANIKNCYFKGEVNSNSSSKGGIAGYSDFTNSTLGSITDCYAVPTFNSGGYGITDYLASHVTITTSYYDKTVSGLSSTGYGTPKSTAAMKMKQTYEADWDFDTVWGINKNINGGYPYLLWEYPDAEDEAEYSIDSVKITDLSGDELNEIPDDNFYIEIDVTKNTNSKEADSLIIAIYDENSTLIDVKYMKGVYYQNQTITFATMINQENANVGKIKTFVWNSVSGVMPLSNAIKRVN